MKRYILYVNVGVVTFISGVLITWCFAQSSALGTPQQVVPQPDMPPLAAQQLMGLKAKFQRFTWEEDVLSAEIEVTNHGSEPMLYTGFSSNRNCSVSIERGGVIKELALCSCMTGVEGYFILARETVTFDVVVGKEVGIIRVGIGLLSAQGYAKQFVWSDRFIVPR